MVPIPDELFFEAEEVDVLPRVLRVDEPLAAFDAIEAWPPPRLVVVDAVEVPDFPSACWRLAHCSSNLRRSFLQKRFSSRSHVFCDAAYPSHLIKYNGVPYTYILQPRKLLSIDYVYQQSFKQASDRSSDRSIDR